MLTPSFTPRHHSQAAWQCAARISTLVSPKDHLAFVLPPPPLLPEQAFTSHTGAYIDQPTLQEQSKQAVPSECGHQAVSSECGHQAVSSESGHHSERARWYTTCCGRLNLQTSSTSRCGFIVNKMSCLMRIDRAGAAGGVTIVLLA